MNNTWSDDVLSGLSAETMKALRDFALQQGVCLDPAVATAEEESDENTGSLLDSVRQHFSIQDRDEVFHIDYKSKDGQREVKFTVKGLKKELGQTLNSTGLTM
jgi:hypothetical protein